MKVLPTKLPLKAFYEELYHLYRHAISMTRRLQMAKRFHLWEGPLLFLKSNWTFGRLRRAYLDCDQSLQVA